MRLFVRHAKDGEIISVAKANILPDGLEHPYGEVGEEEAVLELEPSPELEQIDAHEIAERYTVDVQQKQLKPVSSTKLQGPSRRRRKET